MSDWLLEMMEEAAAEVESEKELVNAPSQSSGEKPVQDDDGFIACKDNGGNIASGPSVTLYDTMVKAVELDRLVWAKCIYYKGAHKPFFPARIRDSSDGATLSPKEIGSEWPIPASKALVQFISLTKKPHNTYEHALLERDKDVIPYDKPLDSKKQSGALDVIEIRPKKNKLSSNSSKGEWNTDNIDNMYEVLSSKFNNAEAKYIKEQIMTAANLFLEKAIAPLPPVASLPTSRPVDSPKRSPTRSAKKSKSQNGDDDVDIVALATKLHSNPIETLVAGDWIAYFNHVFRDSTVFTRISEVIPCRHRKPLILANGDIIALTDSIRKCQPANETGDECIKDSGHYNELRHYKLKKSKAVGIVTLDTKLRLGAKLLLGGGDGLEDEKIANVTEDKRIRGQKNVAKNNTLTDSESQLTSNSPSSSKKRRISSSGSESQSSNQSHSK